MEFTSVPYQRAINTDQVNISLDNWYSWVY